MKTETELNKQQLATVTFLAARVSLFLSFFVITGKGYTVL